MNFIRIIFTLTVASLIFIECQSETKNFLNKSKEVIITGQVINRSNYQAKSIAIIINDVASGEQLRVVDDLDEEGRFEGRFDRFYPQEVMLKYETIFTVFVHPGDSIHIQIDAEKLGTDEGTLHALSFSGDAVEENETISKFLAWFIPLRNKESNSRWAEYKCDPKQYIQYRDSLRKYYHQSRIEFLEKNKVTKIIDAWMFYEIEDDYFHNLVFYPFLHQKKNKLPADWEAPCEYYRFFENVQLPIESAYNASFLKPLGGEFFMFYISSKIQNELKNRGLANDTIFSDGRKGHIWKVNNDSIIIDGIQRYTPKGIFRQVVLNWFFTYQLKEKMSIDLYDKYSTIISTEIKEPFLKVPLMETYKEIKEIAENQDTLRKPMFNGSENTPGIDILKQILEGNKGKVIYIDCWATWCSPCLMEMPYSRKLLHELKDEAVEFVFLCFNSPKEAAQKKVTELKLGGIHYFLDDDQSNHLQKILAFSSFPNYLLVDKDGQVVKSGSDLRPDEKETKSEIMKLINHEK
jgi:thiol-disulfide isomerase/thioredoxin